MRGLGRLRVCAIFSHGAALRPRPAHEERAASTHRTSRNTPQRGDFHRARAATRFERMQAEAPAVRTSDTSTRKPYSHFASVFVPGDDRGRAPFLSCDLPRGPRRGCRRSIHREPRGVPEQNRRPKAALTSLVILGARSSSLCPVQSALRGWFPAVQQAAAYCLSTASPGTCGTSQSTPPLPACSRAVLPRAMPRERQALAYITTLKQLGVCAIVSTTHAKSTAP
jgi:hypothetical protein